MAPPFPVHMRVQTSTYGPAVAVARTYVHVLPMRGPLPGDEKVQILVGPNRARFQVSEFLLHNRSKFLTAALSGAWLESQNRSIVLADEDPDAVRIYLQYLHPPFQLPALSEFLAHDFYALAELYVLGERLQDLDFKNEILDNFIKGFTPHAIDGIEWLPHMDVVNIIYNGTLPTSQGRRLMVDMFAMSGLPSSLDNTNVEDLHPEFMKDLCQKLMGGLMRPKYDVAKALVQGTYREVVLEEMQDTRNKRWSIKGVFRDGLPWGIGTDFLRRGSRNRRSGE
ncbi:BTB POZ domain containing [Lecanosticta acicola]|uniref:BTB POZ domain containing, partial n=1 Tax=Lecanosticta acicola TaxID=111012 RepID=A0AAI9EBW8_9PEZI|nr:BTB POZ domain containing [Lecanosticta acicola]